MDIKDKVYVVVGNTIKYGTIINKVTSENALFTDIEYRVISNNDDSGFTIYKADSKQVYTTEREAVLHIQQRKEIIKTNYKDYLQAVVDDICEMDTF